MKKYLNKYTVIVLVILAITAGIGINIYTDRAYLAECLDNESFKISVRNENTDERFFNYESNLSGEYLTAEAEMQIMEYLEKGNITTYVNTRCVKITDKGIYVVDEKNEERFIEADTVVISAGSKIDKAKREIFKDVAFDVINIGDCYKVGDLQNAIHTAWDAATTL